MTRTAYFLLASTLSGALFLGLMLLLSPRFPPWVAGGLAASAGAVLELAVLAALTLFMPSPSDAEIRQGWEGQGLIAAQGYRAVRAVEMPTHCQEVPHYWLELAEGGWLCLHGDYLAPYEPARNAVRSFPCTCFTIRRHTSANFVVDVECCGEILAPVRDDCLVRDFQRRLDRLPCDGERFTEPERPGYGRG